MPPDCRQKGFGMLQFRNPFFARGGRNTNHKFHHTHNQAYWFCKLHLQQLQVFQFSQSVLLSSTTQICYGLLVHETNVWDQQIHALHSFVK